MFENDSNSSLDSLTNKEIRILDKLSRVSNEISYENRKEEELERELREVNLQIDNVQTPFDLILEKQFVDAEKELFNVQYKLKQQYRLSNALDQLLSALYSSPMQKPKIRKEKRDIKNSSSFIEEDIKQQIEETINQNIKLKESVNKEQMKKNVLESEKLRLSDCIKLLKQRKQKRVLELKKNKLKYDFDYQYYDKISNITQNVESKKKNVFKQYKYICRRTNISNTIPFIPKQNYLFVKLNEYKMRVELTEKLVKQINNIKHKSKNELEKQSFNLKLWLQYLDQMILECLDASIGNVNFITMLQNQIT